MKSHKIEWFFRINFKISKFGLNYREKSRDFKKWKNEKDTKNHVIFQELKFELKKCKISNDFLNKILGNHKFKWNCTKSHDFSKSIFRYLNLDKTITKNRVILNNQKINDAKNHVIFQVSKFDFENRKLLHDLLNKILDNQNF